MSDSDSDEKSDKYKNGNYKSPSKKKRQKKGEGGGLTKTYCFEISLLESNNEKFTEVSFLDLVAKDELRLKKLAAIEKSKNGEGINQNGVGLDPYASDDDDKLKAMAASFEAKYAEKPKKPVGKKRKIHEYDDLGEGYDESDPFIDNSECFDEVVPQEITTAHGGFYINTGALEFKSNQKAVFKISSDDDSSPESKKAKKPKKEAAKKKVQFKDMKKAKVKNTDPKRRARIINTDKNIKGPKIGNGPKVGNPDVKKMDKLKVDIKKIDVKKHLDGKKLEKSEQNLPKSPEKSIPKPPEIIDLEAQLEALSNSVDLSKTESSNDKSNTSVSKQQSITKVSAGSKQEPPVYKSLPVKSLPSTPKSSEPKVPSSVKVTKVESKPMPSASTNGSTPTKPGWQNQINLPINSSPVVSSSGKSSNIINVKEKSKTPPAPQPQAAVSISVSHHTNTAASKESKASWEPKKPTPPSLPKSEVPSISKAMDLSAPKAKTSTTTSPLSMFHHDPKNILSSTPSDMSSILGTTAAYFQQKMQQKAEISAAESKPMFSPPNRGYYTSPKSSKAEGSTVFSTSKSIPSVPKVSSTDSVKSSKDSSISTSAKQGSEVSQEIGRQAAAAYFQKMQTQKQQQNSQVINQQQVPANQQTPQTIPSTVNQQNAQKLKQSSSIGNQQLTSQKFQNQQMGLVNQQQSSQKIHQQSAQQNQHQNNQKLQQQISQGTQQNVQKTQQQQSSHKSNQFLSNSVITDTSPSSTSKIVPDQSKKISSSSGPAKLPTTPNPPDKMGSAQPSQMLTPDMTNSLLGIAQNMMNNLQQQQQVLPQQPSRSSQAVTTQQQQTSAFMQQYQQQTAAAAAATQNKKSSGYDISNLLNSQPLPSAQSNSLSTAARSSPTASQQPVRTQQQQVPSRSSVIPQQHGLSTPQSARSLALPQQSPRSPSLNQQQSPQVARSPSIPHQPQHSQSAARSPSGTQQQQSQAARPPPHSQQPSLSRPQQAAVSPAAAAYSQQLPQIASLQQQYQQAAASSRSPTLSQQPLSQQQVTQAALLQQYQQNYYMGGMGGYQ